MRNKSFKKASNLFKRGKYSRVIQMLEPQVFRYRQSFQFFYFLGMSCLKSSDYGGGYSYLRRAIDLQPGDINTLAGLAIVHLKRHENSEALNHWFQILDTDPGNKIATKGLEVLKKHSSSEDLNDFIESGKFLNLLPGKLIIPPIIKTIFIIFLIIGVSGTTIFFIYNQFKKPNFKRPEIAAVQLDRFGSVINEDTAGMYVFSDEEVRKIFENIRLYFDRYDDNLAMREINRLLKSNAGNSVKEKVRLLSAYIRVPGFTTLKNNFTYQEVIKEPALYENCYVHWKGRFSNLVTNENTITLDFLVGYEDEKILEGIIPVTLDFGARLDSSFPIEILGRVVYESQNILLEAVSVHQFQ